MIGVTFVIVVFGALMICNAVDYCTLKSCSSRSHTLCQYNTTTPSSQCTNYESAVVKPDERETILRVHNAYRQLIASGKELRGNPGPQPAAKKMPNLVWNNELEIIAQRWANQCRFGHDQCRNTETYVVGQNIAQTWHSNPSDVNLENLVKLWYEEVKDFNAANVSKFQPDSKTGHYTQLVWATTTSIGCGMVRYKDRGMITVYLVCNYSPSGNIVGSPIYEIK